MIQNTWANGPQGLRMPFRFRMSTLMMAFLLSAGLFSGHASAQVSVTIRPVVFGTETPQPDPLVTISPNPVSSDTYVQAVQGVEFNGIKVYDTGGNLVFQGTYSEGVVWSTSLIPGLYYFHVDTNMGVEVVTVQVIN